MGKVKERSNRRLNLTLKQGFYDQVKQHADQECLKVSTYVRKVLYESLNRDYENELLSIKNLLKSKIDERCK